jgi:phage gp36-like protein
MARLTQAMLENAVGGAKALRQLLDRDDDDTADASLLAQILDEADAEASSYIGLAVDLSDTAVDTAPVLLLKELDCAVYLCWLRGTQAQAMPEAVRQARQNAIDWYKDVRDRRAGLGLAARPTAAQVVQQVTKTDAEDWFNPAGPRARFNGWA